jgi:hypothetical protein
VSSASVSSSSTVGPSGAVKPLLAAPAAWTVESALDDALKTRAANYYGGLESGDVIVIHVLDGGHSQVESIVRATIATYPTAPLPPGVERSGPIRQLSAIRYVTATATMASLTARTDLLARNSDRLGAEGITLTEWGPDVSANTLDVAVEQPLTPSITAKIEAIVGANNLHLAGGQPPAFTN